MIDTLNEFFTTPGNIDYGEMISAVGRGIVSLICERCDFIKDEKKPALINFQATPVVPFGIPEYEISFAAQNSDQKDGSTEHVLIYPDLNTLSEEHITLLEGEVPEHLKGRPYLHHLVRCIIVVSHEVLHFVQHCIALRDGSPLSWSAEHDASWPSLSLLCAAERACQSSCLTPGLVEACLVYLSGICRSRIQEWTPEVTAAYESWQLHMGLTAQGDGDLPATHGPGGIDPEDAAFNETFRAWKESLAIEGIVESDAELEVQLNLLFNWGGRRERGE